MDSLTLSDDASVFSSDRKYVNITFKDTIKQITEQFSIPSSEDG